MGVRNANSGSSRAASGPNPAVDSRSGARRVEDAETKVRRLQGPVGSGLERARRRGGDRALRDHHRRSRRMPGAAGARAARTARRAVIPRVGAGRRLGFLRVRGTRAPVRSCSDKPGHHHRQREEREAAGRRAGVVRCLLRLDHSRPRWATRGGWEVDVGIGPRGAIATTSHRSLNQPSATGHSRRRRSPRWAPSFRARVSTRDPLSQLALRPPRAFTASPPPPRARKIRDCTAVRTWIGSEVKAKTANARPSSRISP